MTTPQLLCISAFLMVYHHVVLRRYNTLGFRMFSLFFFVGLAVCYWWYTDYVALNDVRKNGMATRALILKKSANSLVFRFADQAGKSVIRTQTGGILVAEFAAITEGQSVPVLYSLQSDTIFLTSGYQRQINNSVYFLVFPALLFLIGIVSGIYLRQYRVYAHEGTIFEYLTDETGKIVLDDTRNSMTKALRTSSTLSKLFQFFER